MGIIKSFLITVNVIFMILNVSSPVFAWEYFVKQGYTKTQAYILSMFILVAFTAVAYGFKGFDIILDSLRVSDEFDLVSSGNYFVFTKTWITIIAITGLVFVYMLANLGDKLKVISYIYTSSLMIVLVAFVAELSVFVTVKEYVLSAVKSSKKGQYETSAASIGIVSNMWNDIQHFNGDIGAEFKKRLEGDHDATWYILNYSAFGLSNTPLYNAMFDASASQTRHIKIKWAYQTPDSVLSSSALSLIQRFILNEKYASRVDQVKKEIVCGAVGRSEGIEISLSSNYEQIRDNILIFHSSAPTFYYGFISVHGDERAYVKNDIAPDNTFGFVMLYGFFPTYENRPTIYFDNTKESDIGWPIADFYFKSTISFFEEGIKEGGYLHNVSLVKQGFRPDGFSMCHEVDVVPPQPVKPKPKHHPKPNKH